MKVKIVRDYFENVSKNIKEKAEQLDAQRVRHMMMNIPQDAKYHIGGEFLDTISSIGQVYYEREKGGKVPIEYLKLTDQLYNKLKQNGINEVAGHSILISSTKIKGFTEDEMKMLVAAVECNYNAEQLIKLGAVKFDEVDLDKKNIKEQLINSRWQGDILDMPINMLTLSYRTGITLTRAGYNTVGDIVCSSESQIANINNIGKKSINEIKSEIAELGLSFKTEEHTL